MRYKHYMSFTPEELHNVLIKRHFKEHERDYIKKIVAEQQAQLKSDNAKRKQIGLYWRELREPLIAERKIVRAMLNYKAKDEEDPRYNALIAYAVMIDKLRGLFDGYERDKMSPVQLAKENNLPHEGIHWVDWIPHKQKHKVYELFEAIPHRARAKKKEPFTRVIPFELHVQLKDRFLRRTEAQIMELERLMRIEPTEERTDTLEQMKKAVNKVLYSAPNSPVPYTWQGALNQEN